MSAAVALRRLAIPENDPLWQAALRAPVDHGPVPEEERLAVEEAAGRAFVDGVSVSEQIAAMRAR